MADLRRSYVKIPQLVQTAVQLPPVPLSADDWDGMRRLLDAMKHALEGTDGVSGSFLIGATSVIFDKGKLISIA